MPRILPTELYAPLHNIIKVLDIDFRNYAKSRHLMPIRGQNENVWWTVVLGSSCPKYVSSFIGHEKAKFGDSDSKKLFLQH